MCGCVCTCGHARCVSGALSIDWTIGVGHQMALSYIRNVNKRVLCVVRMIYVSVAVPELVLFKVFNTFSSCFYIAFVLGSTAVGCAPSATCFDALGVQVGGDISISSFFPFSSTRARRAVPGRSCRPDPPSSPRLATTIVANMRRATFRLQRTNQLVYARPRRSRRSSSSTAR